LDVVQASLINPNLIDDSDLPATLNPAQVDVGYSQELSEYSAQKNNRGEK
jgi:cytochrome d ubiquinol oxidase subunit I